METVSLRPVDRLTLVSLVDNAVDPTAPSRGPASRRSFGPDPITAAAIVGGQGRDPLIAEHGFSMFVEIESEGRVRRLLFDTGVSPTGVIDNARRLEVDLTAVEAIVLSHGHYDHTTGMSGLMGLLGPAGLPVVLHPEAWTDRRIVIPDGGHRPMPTPSRSAIEGAGFEIIEESRPSHLFGESVLVTGEVDRTTPFETGFPGHEQRGTDGWHADPDIRDDQALVVDVKDRGLVVLTGCGHAGVVNIVGKAQALTGVDRILAVVGGFHLGGRAFHARIPATVAALSSFSPGYLIPAHCTGFEAAHALAQAMGEAVIPNLVGTRYEWSPSLLGEGAPVERSETG